MTARRVNAALTAARWIVGATFVLSGFVKSVDPVGTSIFVDEYLATYSLLWLKPFSLAMAVALGAAELSVGVMLCSRTGVRIASVLAMIALAIFTVVTLLSATLLPIGDCGCFGEALSLSPWGTFAKNAVLLPMAFWVWRSTRCEPLWPMSRNRIIALTATVAVAVGINLYALRHLPLIDFLPYKVGVDLREEIGRERESLASAQRTMMMCRNEMTGAVEEFDSADPTWWNGWEVISTRTENGASESRFADFALYSADGGELSEQVLGYAARQHLLCIARMERLSPRCQYKIDAFLSRAESRGERVLCLTTDDLEGEVAIVAGHAVGCCNVDAMVLRSMLRAEAGVVTLDDGVIVDKRSWRDM
ncbi:MAG: DoxX protein [Alistipes sp.]|nr:DoxX protein [Alistipes sp.]